MILSLIVCVSTVTCNYKCEATASWYGMGYVILYVWRNLFMENTIETQLAVLYTVEPLYRGHHWDPAGCPEYSGTSL